MVSAEIAGDPSDTSYPTSAPGHVPASWLDGRSVGTATVDATFVDLGHSVTLAHLRVVIAAAMLRFGIDDLDAAAIRLHAPRRLTQEIASYLYDLVDEDGERLAQGIEYGSRLGDEIENWAIWEPANDVEIRDEQPLSRDDPDVAEAMVRFGLALGG